MGLIKTALNSARGTMADQWKEYFYCDALPNDVLMTMGRKRTGRRSSNHGSNNIITTGSVIAVADGQAMLIVEQGRVVEFSAEPGEFVFDASTQPTVFAGNLGDSIGKVFQDMGKRFSFGAETPMDQRVYYINTKEILSNKYGTPNPVAFRVVDERAGIDMDVPLRCFGEYSFKITNPMLFYNFCGNVSEDYTRDRLEGQMRSELLTALQPALGRLSDMGIRYSSLLNHTTEIRDALKTELSELWGNGRGLEIVNFGISSMKADEEVEKELREMQREASYMDPTRMAARLGSAQAEAMKIAAGNKSGAAMAFMGMNMAGNAGGMNPQTLYQMGAQQKAQEVQDGWKCPECGTSGNTGNFCGGCGKSKPAPAGSWTCECGTTATGKFCPNCGKAKPVSAGSWTCECGAQVTGKFCPECGKPKPSSAAEGWTCPQCGKINQGKFCAECGQAQPKQLRYKCNQCGWEPKDPTNPPKFCPECGNVFDENDIVP